MSSQEILLSEDEKRFVIFPVKFLKCLLNDQ